MARKDITDIIQRHWGVDLPSGVRCLTEHEPVDYSNSSDFRDDLLVRPSPEGNALIVGYVLLDNDYGSFWDHGEPGAFHEFTRNEDVRETLKEAALQTPRPLVVQRYSHGAVHYSLTGTMRYPGHDWDVGTAGLYTPPADLYERFLERSAAIGEDEARKEYFSSCNAILDEFSEWANGHVYSMAVERWTLDGERSLPESGETELWGPFYGWEQAEAALRDEIGMEIAPPVREAPEEALPSPSP